MRVLVIGGYGTFGRLCCESLASLSCLHSPIQAVRRGTGGEGKAESTAIGRASALPALFSLESCMVAPPGGPSRPFGLYPWGSESELPEVRQAVLRWSHAPHGESVSHMESAAAHCRTYDSSDGHTGTTGKSKDRRLPRPPRFTIVVAGRSSVRAAAEARRLNELCHEAFGHVVGCDVAEPAEFDASRPTNSLSERLAQLQIDCVLHTAGPFLLNDEGSGPCESDFVVARACIDAGVNYVDISDEASWVSGITNLNSRAASAGVCVISGASTTPAVSMAAADALLQEVPEDERRAVRVSSFVSPGNSTPRSPGTTASVLKYAGQHFPTLVAGKWDRCVGWAPQGARMVVIPGLRRARLVTDVMVADRIEGPRRWGAGCRATVGSPPLDLLEVSFKAGLELWVLQAAICGMASFVQYQLVSSRRVTSSAPWLSWLSSVPPLSLLGTADGGMRVELDFDGECTKSWDLWVGSGDGPRVPCAAAVALVHRLALRAPLYRVTTCAGAQERFEAGASPCIGFLDVDEVMQYLSPFDLVLARDGIAPMSDDVSPRAGIFERALGSEAFSNLPAAVRLFHDSGSCVTGSLAVKRGSGRLAWIAGWIARFPSAGEWNVMVTTKALTDASGSQVRAPCGAPRISWNREFTNPVSGQRVTLTSSYSSRAGLLTERFGPFSIGLQMRPAAVGSLDIGAKEAVWEGERCSAGFAHVQQRLWVLGIPVPDWMAVRANGVSLPHHDGLGWFVKVRVSAPIIGEVLTYTGHVRLVST